MQDAVRATISLVCRDCSPLLMERYMLKITIPLPPSLNASYANAKKGRTKTAKAYAWEQLAGYLLNPQKPEAMITGEIGVVYSIYYKDRRKNDIANREKLTSDLLVKHGVIEDDSNIGLMVLKKSGIDKENPRVEIIIVPVEKLTYNVKD